MQSRQNPRKYHKSSPIAKTSNKKLKNEVTYSNQKLLALFLDDRKKILPRSITGLSFQKQKKLNKAIKSARILGMYPFTAPSI